MSAAPVIVIGAGIAGLSAALHLAPRPVTVLTGAPLGEGAATAWAQGGIAAALGPDDSPAQHAADTVAAGAGLVDGARARLLAESAPQAIAWLESLGAPFDRDAQGALILGREAAHGRNRIVHAGGDGSGAAVMQTLIAAARQTPSITLLAGWRADDLALADGRVTGVHVRKEAQADFLPAAAVVLATGGIGQLYAYTTNPPSAGGDGLAMAARAGVLLGDLEFVQFHPTALAIPRDPLPLLTEALRGEGAVLVNETGARFMKGEHEAAELAPRDVVARAIWRQMQAGHTPLLDLRALSNDAFAAKYANVYKACREAGLDPVRQPLPVAPAAHYHMGGVVVDENGRTSLPGLWACGEVACTGVHGANRLASNSLLEALVFARLIARDLSGEALPQPAGVAPAVTPPPVTDSARHARLRKLMFAQCGLVREAEGLKRLLTFLAETLHAPSSAELVASLVALMALQRQESRGAHCRSDFSSLDPAARRSTLAWPSARESIYEALGTL